MTDQQALGIMAAILRVGDMEANSKVPAGARWVTKDYVAEAQRMLMSATRLHPVETAAPRREHHALDCPACDGTGVGVRQSVNGPLPCTTCKGTGRAIETAAPRRHSNFSVGEPEEVDGA